MMKPKTKPRDVLPAAKDLVIAIEKEKHEVLEAFAQEGMSAKLARRLHNLALLCTTFGHLPPIRLSGIRSLMVPSYSGPCLDLDCKHDSNCHGNQLKHTPEHGLQLHLPHHKNERRWERAIISFTLPEELAKLLKLHITKGWKMLTSYNGAEDTCHVFVDGKGRPFNDSNFAIYWNSMVQAMGLPPFSPSQCRQMFVEERRSPGKVEGPNERGAAMVMGHSVAQWDKWYDQSFHARQAQEAVDAMTKWRHGMLAPTSEANVQQDATHAYPPQLQQPHPLAALMHGPLASTPQHVPSSSLPNPLTLSEDDIWLEIDDDIAS